MIEIIDKTTTESANANPLREGVAFTDAQRGLLRERMYLDGREANARARLNDTALPEQERVMALKHHASILHHREVLQEVLNQSSPWALDVINEDSLAAPVRNN